MNIEITRFDGGLRINPSPPYVLKYLKYFHRGMKTVRFRRECVFEERLLYSLDKDGYLFTMPGFYKPIVKMIKKFSDTCTVVDLRTPMPEIDWNRVKKIKLRAYQPDLVVDMLLAAMDDNGVVNAAGGIGKTYLEALLCTAFSELNIIVAIPLKEVVTQTYKKFKELFPDKHIGIIGDGMNDISTDITITTFRSLKSCALEKCEMLIVDELQSAGQPTFQNCLLKMHPRRVFGFSATPDGTFNNTDKLLRGVFGEDIVFFPYIKAEAVEAVVPGFVYMVKMPQDYVAGNYDTIETKFKYNVKKNDVRNALIGKVCSLIPDGWQTILFVDHVKDHLVPLFKYLPKDAKYLHRDSSKKSAGAFALTNKQQKEIALQFANNEFKTLVATDAFRAGVDIPNCRVVIQAASGSSKVEVLQEALRGSRILTDEQIEKFGLTKKTHFVLVDFMDNHDPMLEGMARKRIQYYKEQGWDVRIVDNADEIDFNNTNKGMLL